MAKETPPFRAIQSSFTAGELSPALWARVDLSKYASGLKTAKNIFIHPHGGASNRAGLQFVAETKGSGIARQIPFIFDVATDQTYDLVFTDLKMRVYRAGAPILEGDKTITAVTQASPGIVTSAAHGYSNGDEIVITSVAGMTELNGRNFIVAGKTTNTFTLKDMYGNAVDTSGYTAYSSGGTANAIYEVTTPYAEDDIDKLVFAQEKDVMYITHVDYAPRKLARLADDSWTLTTPTFAPAMSAPTGLTATAIYKFRSGEEDNGATFKVTAVSASGAESAASAATAGVDWQFEFYDGRYIRVSWTAVSGAASYNIYKTDTSGGLVASTSNAFADMPRGPGSFIGDGSTAPTVSDTGAPSTPTGVTAAIVFGDALKYKVSAVSDDTGEESLPSSAASVNNDLGIAGNKNLLSWDAVSGASAYIVYRLDNGLYGYIGRTETTSFTDENITPDISDGPQSGNNPFDSASDYPRCVTFFEQRLAFAGTINEPSAVWLGQSANYENFGSADPAKDSDAITFRIRSREKNEIRGLVPLRGLGVFSSASEWMVTGGSQDFISPTQIVTRPQSYRGMSYVQPIVVGNVVLFAQARGGVVRDFSYDFANDGFTGTDLTILARHLFEGKSIKSWAYSQSPYSMVWVVLDDGALVSLTYLREHEVWAWTRHETDGTFEDVTVIPEGEEDVPYFVVNRTINGATKRYIEKLHTREFDGAEDCFFVDCGLTYDGTAVTSIRGLDHLEGEMVVALADGNVVTGLTVTDGAVTLPNAAAKAHIGLAYEALMKTLDIDMGMIRGLGTVQGRYKSIGEITLRVQGTRGIFVGPNEAHLTEWKQRQFEDWGEAINLYTGDFPITPTGDWTRGGTMIIKQVDPLPMTILAIMPDVALGA